MPNRALLAAHTATALAMLAALFFCVSDARADDADPWLSRDKALHFDASAGIAAAGYAVSAAWLVDPRWKALALGGGLAVATGAGKELVDAAGVFHGDPSWKDFTWDAIGAVVGLALAWGADLLIGGTGSEHPVLGEPHPQAASAGQAVPAALRAGLNLRF